MYPSKILLEHYKEPCSPEVCSRIIYLSVEEYCGVKKDYVKDIMEASNDKVLIDWFAKRCFTDFDNTDNLLFVKNPDGNVIQIDIPKTHRALANRIAKVIKPHVGEWYR